MNREWYRNALLVGMAGVLASAAGFVLDRQQFLRSYLVAYIFWTGMGIGCLGILLMHHVVGGKWGMVIRRMCEAGARTLPLTLVAIIPILLNIPALYVWARPEAASDPVIHAKAAYLNIPGFVGRAILYFAVWTFYGYRLSSLSVQQDAQQDSSGNEHWIGKMRAISAPGLVMFTVVSTFAFIDWIMSLEPDWFSTVYGAMFLIGQVLQAFAWTIALAIVLSARGPLREFVTKQHLHDLGNLMFAFMVLWAYLSFSQFLIIWAGNLPEEIPWYVRRLHHGWGWVAMTLVVFHFATPFALLLMRGVKRQANRLLMVCVLMLGARVVDTDWIVAPAFFGEKIRIDWMDFATLAALGGLWCAAFLWQLNSRPILPFGDPRLQGAPRETVAY